MTILDKYLCMETFAFLTIAGLIISNIITTALLYNTTKKH